MWIAHTLGWGLPALFLAISLPVTGVSYRLGLTCLPNPHGAFVTWFGWLIAFAGLAALIQFITTGFCLAVFLRSYFVQSTPSTIDDSGSSGRLDPTVEKPPASLGRRFAWGRVKKVMLLQWRSLLLSVLVTIEVIYFGVVCVAQTKTQQQSDAPERVNQNKDWTACLVLSGGDKNQCMHLAKPLRLPEGAVVGTQFMSAVSALLTTQPVVLLIRTRSSSDSSPSR